MRSPSPRLVGWALLALLLADAKAVAHLRADRPSCAGAALPPASRLQVQTSLAQATVLVGQTVRGTATVTNRGTTTRVVSTLGAVLREPATDRSATWISAARSEAVTLQPGEYTELPFVLHVARCPGTGGLTPGFYELLVLLRSEAGVERSAARAVVVSPGLRQK